MDGAVETDADICFSPFTCTGSAPSASRPRQVAVPQLDWESLTCLWQLSNVFNHQNGRLLNCVHVLVAAVQSHC